jgi:hypothetical protein
MVRPGIEYHWDNVFSETTNVKQNVGMSRGTSWKAFEPVDQLFDTRMDESGFRG